MKAFKNNSPVETFLGFVVVIFAIAFLWWASAATKLIGTQGQIYKAKFENLNGLPVGADVKINGVKVGSVVDAELNPKTYEATIEFSVKSRFKIPFDSKLKIESESLLGGKVLVLIPGSAEKILNKNDVLNGITSPSLEDIISGVIFSMGDNSDTKTVAPLDDSNTNNSTVSDDEGQE